MIKFYFFIIILHINNVFGNCYTTTKKCQLPPSNNIQKTVIFIDFNKSATEVKCARLAACERGEYLDIFPKKKSGKKITKKTLKSFLEKVEKDKNNNVSSITFSGHQTGARYFGDNGEIRTNELIEIFSKLPRLSKTIDSVFAWGCYTANGFMVKNTWLKMFPNLDLVFGFDLKGPSSTAKSSYTLLYDSLKEHDRLIKSASLKKFKKHIQNLNNIEYTNAAIFLRPNCFQYENGSDLYFQQNKKGNDKYSDFANLGKNCEKKINQLKTGEKEIYLRIIDGVLPLQNSHPSRGTVNKLREFYELVQSNSLCIYSQENDEYCYGYETDEDSGEQVCSDEEYPAFNYPEEILHLIFAREIGVSFFKNYKDEIAKAQRLKTKLFETSEMNITIDDTNSYDLIKRVRNKIQKSKNKIKGLSKKHGCRSFDEFQIDENCKQIQQLYKWNDLVKDVLTDHNSNIIPPSWFDKKKARHNLLDEKINSIKLY